MKWVMAHTKLLAVLLLAVMALASTGCFYDHGDDHHDDRHDDHHDEHHDDDHGGR